MGKRVSRRRSIRDRHVKPSLGETSFDQRFDHSVADRAVDFVGQDNRRARLACSIAERWEFHSLCGQTAERPCLPIYALSGHQRLAPRIRHPVGSKWRAS
jgi:hypothetical protein